MGVGRAQASGSSGGDPTVAVAPLHGDDPIRVRLARHAVGIVTLTVGAAVLGLVGVFPDPVPWWAPSLVLLVASVTIAAVYASNPGGTLREMHRRAGVQTVALAAVTYVTGWGFALPFVHLFGIADNINESGSRTSRVTLGWAVGATTVAQVAVQVRIAPVTAISVQASHLVAGITLVLLVLVTRRLRSAAAAGEHARAELDRSERRFRTLVEDATDMVLLLDEHLVITYASPSVGAIGLDDAALVGETVLSLIHDGDVQRVGLAVASFLDGDPAGSLLSFRMLDGSGAAIEAEAGVRDLLDDPDVGALVFNVRDESERRRLEAAIKRSHSHDTLTGLPNRGTLVQRVETADPERPDAPISLLVVGVVGYDAVLEAAGHDAADGLVWSVAQDLLASVSDDDVLARIGEDRFGVLVGKVDGMAALHAAADRLRTAVERDVSFDGTSLPIDGAVGIVVDRAGRSADDAVGAGELAERAARRSSSAIVVFEESMRDELRARLALEQELASAIDRHQFVVHYQPLVDLGGDASVAPRLVGVEALVRWEHPVRGLLSPGSFIGFAEETGQIVDIGWHVLDRALAQLASWDVLLGTGTIGYVSVNVSMLQFSSGELAARVESALARHDIAAHRLLLELTETSLAADPDRSVPQLSVLAALGVELAIDDFGTGYSSMAYLQDFPLHVLKIDRAFVSRDADAHRPELLGSLQHLGDALGLKTVAEGIETADELAAVREMRFDVGQGYLFGAPAPADTLTAAVRARQAREAAAAAAVAGTSDAASPQRPVAAEVGRSPWAL